MTLDELIYNRLSTNTQVTQSLARFAGKPALFYQSPPGDAADGWGTATQYPRVDYTVEMQADPERHTSGQLVINIWSSDDGVMPEGIAGAVRTAMTDVFFSTGDIFSLTWQRSDAFEAQAVTVKGAGIVGITIIFDIWGFPSQQTTAPSPIAAINSQIKTQYPNARVIGIDVLPPQFMPTQANPVIYFRTTSQTLERQTGRVRWYNAEIAGHIIAPDINDRAQITKTIVEGINRRLPMADGSPAFLLSISADSGNNHMSQGQIRIRTEYGMLTPEAQTVKLMHPHISQ